MVSIIDLHSRKTRDGLLVMTWRMRGLDPLQARLSELYARKLKPREPIKPRFRVCGAEMRITRLELLFAGGLVMSPVSGHTSGAISFTASNRVQVYGDYHSAGSKGPSTQSSALSPTSLSLRGFGRPLSFRSSKWTASKAPGQRW